MALEKKIEYRGEFLTDGQVQVCEVTTIYENGIAISSNNQRHVICPGDDYTNEPKVVKDICAVVQTPQIVAKYKAKIKEQDDFLNRNKQK